MNITKSYLELLTVNKKSKGFTLIELLVAIFMSSIVLTAMGSGMMAVLNNNKTSGAKTDVKNQLNRAIDYINDDIKKARISEIKESTVGSGIKDTVVLTYFDSLSSTTSHTITYSLINATNPWLGPKVLQRKVDSGNQQVLVDRLTENTIQTNNSDPSKNFNCTGTSTTLSIGGFQACIQTQTGSNGAPLYRTNIALFGEISDTAGTIANSSVIKISTDTISRSVTPVIDPPVLSFTPDTDVTPDLTWDQIQGATSYNIYKCTTTDSVTPCTPTTLLGSDSASPWLVSDATSTPGSRSCYRGVSTNGTVTSNPGSTICTIIAATAVPTAITDLNATDVVQPVVTWTRKTTAVGYKLYRCETSNISTPCTINTATDTPIATFTAVTDAAFTDYVPLTETTNPSGSNAFCYGVVSTNDVGSSSLSNVNCGVSSNLTLNTTATMSLTLDSTQVSPSSIAWTTNLSSVIGYDLVRCETSSTTCNPTSSGTTIVNNQNATGYNDSSQPAIGNRFCYAARARSATAITNYSSVSTSQCGAARPPECTLNLLALGAGATPTYDKSSANSTDRTTLTNIVTSASFSTPITTNALQSGYGSVLYAVKNGSTNASLAGADTRTLPCNTPIAFTWYYPLTFGDPIIAITPDSSPSYKTHSPTITWAPVPTATRYDLWRCSTTSTSCTPTLSSSNITSPYSSPAPSNGSRYCYGIKAYNGTTLSNLSNVVCGDIRL